MRLSLPTSSMTMYHNMMSESHGGMQRSQALRPFRARKPSARASFARSSTDSPASPPSWRGCRLCSAAQKRSASRRLKPTSALACSPNAVGVSGGIASSMYSSVCTGSAFKAGGADHPAEPAPAFRACWGRPACGWRWMAAPRSLGTSQMSPAGPR